MSYDFAKERFEAPQPVLCACGCKRLARTESSWLSMDSRMFATETCRLRFTVGVPEWVIGACGHGFDDGDGGRVGREWLCPDCYHSHPVIVAEAMRTLRADERRDGAA